MGTDDYTVRGKQLHLLMKRPREVCQETAQQLGLALQTMCMACGTTLCAQTCVEKHGNDAATSR